MRITFFELEEWEKVYVEGHLPGFACQFYDKPLTLENTAGVKECPILAVFVHSAVDKETIAALPDLRYLTTMSTGFDHIDLEACKQRGIAVSNGPAYGDNTVAAHAFP